MSDNLLLRDIQMNKGYRKILQSYLKVALFLLIHLFFKIDLGQKTFFFVYLLGFIVVYIYIEIQIFILSFE
jgi:hypothetical protein